MGMWHFEAINIGADSSGRETERQLAARFFPEVSQLKFRSESLSANSESLMPLNTADATLLDEPSTDRIALRTTSE